MMEKEIKNEWQSTRFNPLSSAQKLEIVQGNRITALQRLARRYKWFANISLPMIIFVPGLILKQVLYGNPWKFEWAIFAVCYFGIASVMDYWLYKGISSIDCSLMNVREVVTRSMYYRKRHLQFMMVLLPMAVILIGSLAYIAFTDKYMLLGMCIGAVVGLIIGARQFMEFMNDYKTIRIEDIE